MSTAPAQLSHDTTDLDRRFHFPFGRRESLAYVFCGPTQEIERSWLFEHDAWDTLRYALTDPTLDEGSDYARSSGRALPRWPDRRLAPTPGTLFVIARREQSAAEQLRAAGAIEGVHYVCLDTLPELLSLRRTAWEQTRDLPRDAEIAVLGFGDQGRRIVDALINAAGRTPETICVYDEHPDSIEAARRAGVRLVTTLSDLPPAALYVYSPYRRFEPLYSWFLAAGQDGGQLWDNSLPKGYYTPTGSHVLLGPRARHTITAHGNALRWKAPAPPCPVHYYRHDRLTLGSRTVDHLSDAGTHRADDAGYLPVVPPGYRRLGTHLLTEHVRSYLETAADSRSFVRVQGYFAAADVCRSHWPGAVDDIFPAQALYELGRTEFERRIAQIVSGFANSTPKQTSAEQLAVGVAARHYADRPDTPIIEIGVALGGTTVLLAAATCSARPQIIAIDPAEMARRAGGLALDACGYGDRVRFVSLTSQAAAGRLAELRGRVGLVLIDGAHDGPSVAQDFRLYAPLLRPGGCLLMHDFDPAHPGVMSVILNHVLKDPRFQLELIVDRLAIFQRR